MQTSKKPQNLQTVIAIVTAILALISILIMIIGIYLQIKIPEIRCWMNLDDCQSKTESDKVLIKEPVEVLKKVEYKPSKELPIIINLQNNESKYFGEYQVSLGLKFNVFDGEQLASLTISPTQGETVRKPILSGYNFSYLSFGKNYQVTILHIDYEAQNINLRID